MDNTSRSLPHSGWVPNKQLTKIVYLNPIIADKDYFGIFDGDPRIEECSERLVKCMRASGLFLNRVIITVESAGKSRTVTQIHEAIDKLYDFADENDIYLGEASDEPEDAKRKRAN